MADYENATRTVQPSSKIEELYTIPNAKWDDVVGLQLLKQEFDRHIIRPIKFPDVYKDLGMNLTTTFFLYGPSGCGKTMIVEALANEAGANFIHIKCPELLNNYVDHRELVLEKILSNATTWSPCILFFDEMKEAVLAAIDRPTLFGGGCRTPWTIKDEYFKRALKKISPTVSPMNMADYMSFSKEIVRRRAKLCDGKRKT